MILYDKECNLIGVAKDVLVFLGYEDVEEFKTYNNDIADLFVNRLGYVYKFQNFSWIDYILYSGAPSKNAIIKKKNGKEVEVGVSVQEIYPFGPLESHQALYSVTLHTQHLNAASLSQTPEPATLIVPPEPENSPPPSFEIYETPSDTPIPTAPYEEGLGFSSLHFDEPITFSTENQAPNEKLSVSFEEEPLFPAADIFATDDTVKAQEALGLDSHEILPLLEEYLGHLEMVSYALEEAIEHHDSATKNELVKQIIGTAQMFQMEELVSTLKGLLENKGEPKEYFSRFQDFIASLKHSLNNNHNTKM